MQHPLTLTDGLVLAGSLAFLALFYWWFFWSKREERAEATLSGASQEVTVVVKGGYSPDTITLRQGVPVRLNFRREEASACTDRVVMPAFHINQELPAYETTTVRFTPDQPGEFGFECGMGMIHGKVVVEAGRP
jgi:Cu+-exporting ATPase